MSQYPPHNPSQYPSPYYPPHLDPHQMSFGGPSDLLAPARRASVMMFILGPVLLLCGGCVMSMPLMFSMVPSDKLQPMIEQIESTYGFSAQVVFPVIGAVILLPGLALLVLAFFVRRGGRVSAILASVLVGLVLLKSIVELLFSFLHATDPNAIKAICLDVFCLGLFGTLFSSLIQAIRASSTVKQAQQQYLAQYWQYQQTMQAHAGYGYAAPPQEGQVYLPQAAPTQPQASPPPLPQEPASDDGMTKPESPKE